MAEINKGKPYPDLELSVRLGHITKEEMNLILCYRASTPETQAVFASLVRALPLLR
jgi:hypothetical protein